MAHPSAHNLRRCYTSGRSCILCDSDREHRAGAQAGAQTAGSRFRACPPQCRYCGNHNPATVAQCEVTGKWFCNGHVNSGGTCIVQHLVRGRFKEIRLHPESALGNTVLECYHSGSRNVFALGFVPVKADDTMVLLTRDTPATAACVKDLDLDLSLWEPILQVRDISVAHPSGTCLPVLCRPATAEPPCHTQDRAIVPWLVQSPTREEVRRARKLKPAQMTQLEAAWKKDPDADLQQVQEANVQQELLRVALRYVDAYEYQHVLAPLVQIEADYDKVRALPRCALPVL